MLKIQKGEGEGKKELLVPNGAFKNFFEGAGWHRVGVVSEVKADESEEDEWSDYEEGEEDDEFTKPLSEMSRAELEAYAAKLGVDLTGLNSNKQYREAIKAAM